MQTDEIITVDELIAALRARSPLAREQYRNRISHPLRQLLDKLVEQNSLQVPKDQLLEHALTVATAFARTCPLGEFTNWKEFQSCILFQVARLILTPAHTPSVRSTTPTDSSTSKNAVFQLQAISIPHHPTCSGDWYSSHSDERGTEWVLVTNVTDFGLLASLVASAIPELWCQIWSTDRRYHEPWEVLAELHDDLAECLPPGIFVESTLVQLQPTGCVKISPAGSQTILRKARSSTDLHRLSGGWLGLMRPEFADQHQFQMSRGDELLLATEGFYSQIADAGLSRLLMRHSVGSLYESAEKTLRESFESQSANDDITVVVASYFLQTQRAVVSS